MSNQQALLHRRSQLSSISTTPDDSSHFQVISSSASRQANTQPTRGCLQDRPFTDVRRREEQALSKWPSMHPWSDPICAKKWAPAGVVDCDPFGQLLVSSQPTTRTMTKGLTLVIQSTGPHAKAKSPQNDKPTKSTPIGEMIRQGTRFRADELRVARCEVNYY